MEWFGVEPTSYLYCYLYRRIRLCRYVFLNSSARELLLVPGVTGAVSRGVSSSVVAATPVISKQKQHTAQLSVTGAVTASGRAVLMRSCLVRFVNIYSVA